MPGGGHTPLSTRSLQFLSGLHPRGKHPDQMIQDAEASLRVKSLRASEFLYVLCLGSAFRLLDLPAPGGSVLCYSQIM